MKLRPFTSNRLTALLIAAISLLTASADSIPRFWNQPVRWRLGLEASPSGVLHTNSFVRGDNPHGRPVTAAIGADLRADLSFAGRSPEAILYPGLYQGLALGFNTYTPASLLGTTATAYIYQGAPIVHITPHLWLGYEWQFGAAIGWRHDNTPTADNNTPVSTPVTALMGIAFKLHYRLDHRWTASLGILARHYSNGNTSWPNSGINTAGATLGIAYTLGDTSTNTPADSYTTPAIDHTRWFYDITLYGAWRKRAVTIQNEPLICPGRFGVIGLRFSPMRQLNRFVAVGPSLDMQYDEGAGITPYWVEGSYGDNIKFHRPPFRRQLFVGLSANAELTMPVFSVNAGLGYDIVSPRGDRRFYQSLTLKTFVTPHIYLNVGYRLAAFKDPQNLMLGIGYRIH